MRSNTLFLAVFLLFHLLFHGANAGAQTCDDFEPCSSNDMCVDGECIGTPSDSGSCDDFDPCTINDRCTAMGCMGDPAPVGTTCAEGCGTCQQLVPFPGFPLFCTPKAGIQGQACTPGGEIGENLCVTGVCQVILDTAVACAPSFRQCPDTDGVACTDVCNPETGQCIAGATRCVPGCETCNAVSGACQPANLGAACDDFDPCTTASSCQQVGGFGLCLAGTPSAGSPTPTTQVSTATQTPPVATATRTQPVATATHTQPVATATRTAGPPTSTPTEVITAATATPMETQTTAVSTPTPGGPSATATAAAGTATPTMPVGTVCVGDCNRNSEVRIGELILGVNIALGQANLAQCTAFDPNGDDRVAINELIQGTGNALEGCPS
jgi:hypothetical protein